MLLSELIERLSQIKGVHGDMPVFCMTGYDNDERRPFHVRAGYNVRRAKDTSGSWSGNSVPKPKGYSDVSYLDGTGRKWLYVPVGNKYLQF